MSFFQHLQKGVVPEDLKAEIVKELKVVSRFNLKNDSNKKAQNYMYHNYTIMLAVPAA